ncbi:splicing factor 1-like isoform X4 [Ptychodera flava]|uniref:splicing factor 1-like isoform X4 n=1 Tax=Ptychodera flava TaxID=63121 RepID=UPI00396A84BB
MNMAATGANSIPLGKPNPAISGGRMSSESMLNAAREAAARIAEKRRVGNAALNDQDGGNKRKRRSRWEQPTESKPPVPTVLPPNLTPDQEKQFLLHLQIEELSRRLRTGDLGIPPNPEDRSPSPEPIYNSEGKRLNTREYRTRKKIEEERHKLIQEALQLNTEYKPPADYKPPVQRVSDRVMIPQDKHPDINFVGLLIGPRGNTLKKMEKETSAKIMIRGKGSVKEGKVGRKDGQPLPGEDEPLHALVTANNAESVKKAVDQINEIIRQGIDTPEGQNDLKRMQLRELAALNGTLRDAEAVRCTNCGASSHRTWQCTERQNITNTVQCSQCGGAGHIAADCRQKRDRAGGFGPTNTVDKAKMDSEYLSLMAELGEGPPPPAAPSNMSHHHPSSGPRPLLSTPMSQNAPPPWMQNKQEKQHHNMMDNRPPSLLGSGPNQPPPSLMSQHVQPHHNMPPPPPPNVSNQPWNQPPPAPPSSASVPPPPPPSLLAAPPPPPPTSEPPPPLPTSQSWQGQTSSAPTLATSPAGAPPPWYQNQGSSSASSTSSSVMPPPPPWQVPPITTMAHMPPWHQPPPPPMPPPQHPGMMPPPMQPGMPPPPVQPPLPPGPPPPPPMGMMPYGQPPPPPPPVDMQQNMGAVPPLLPPAPPPPPPN